MVAKVSSDFKKQVAGYGLTTAEILYRRPDYNWLLQSYVWQDYDLFPEFPSLKRFLAFWEAKLEGPLFKVTVAHQKLIKPADFRAAEGVSSSPAPRRPDSAPVPRSPKNRIDARQHRDRAVHPCACRHVVGVVERSRRRGS